MHGDRGGAKRSENPFLSKPKKRAPLQPQLATTVVPNAIPSAGGRLRRPPLFTVPGATGMLEPGNLDLNSRPDVLNADGSHSSVRSLSVGTDEGTFLIPTVLGNRKKVVSKAEAIDHFLNTGEHLGKFRTHEDADAYSGLLHREQAKGFAAKTIQAARLGRAALDKQATVFAAEQTLKPWELPPQQPGKRAGGRRASPEARYKAAVGAPIDAPVKVGKRTEGAREFLAETLTPKRRQQYEQISAIPVPRPDSSFLHALLSTPGSISHNITAGSEAVGKKLFRGPILGEGPAGGLVPSRRELAEANKSLVGPALYNAVTQGQGSHLGAAGLEAAAILPPFKALRALKLVGRGAKAAEKAAPLEKALGPLTKAQSDAQNLVTALPQASRLVRDEKALRSKELGVRTREAQRRLEAGGYTEEARKHASEALAGAMPTLNWGRFTEMTPETLDDMVHHIETHPAFQGDNSVAFFKRKNTRDALARIMSGYHPRDFEIRLLREAFGDVTTQHLIDSVGFWKKNGNRVLNVIGIPRSLLSSFDLSAPLRQNLVFATSHPVLWSKNFKPMIKAFGSTAVQDQVVRDIVSDPNYDLMQRADIRFTDMGHDIVKREEGFQSSYAETITGGKVSPVRASNRAYVTFNNKSRADLFNFLLEKVNNLHPDLNWQSAEGDKMLKEMGRLVNNATGRGKFPIKTLERSLPILNATLFSPRLLASRLDVLSYPATVWTMNSVTRNEALKQLGALTGAVTGVVGLAALAGAKIVHDPRNADFGKVRVGSTRFDVAGGFLQPIRLAAQLGPERLGGGKIISSTTGKTLSLTDRKFGGANRLGIFLRFLESKESPPVGFIVNWSRGTDFAGKPFSVQSEAYNRLVPLLVQDAKQAYDSGDSNTGSVALATAIYGIGMWGIGAQTYGPRKPTQKSSADPFTTGSNPFMSSGSSTSNPFMSP